MAVLLGEGDEAPPGLRGKTGLHAVGIAAVVAAGGLQELIGRRDRPGRMQLRGGQQIGRRIRDPAVGGICVTGQRDLGHVPGCGVVPAVVEAVRAGEVGRRAAQLVCPDVHLRCKRGETAGSIIGQHAGRIVGAGQEHGVHHVDAAHHLACLQADGVAPVGPDGL